MKLTDVHVLTVMKRYKLYGGIGLRTLGGQADWILEQLWYQVHYAKTSKWYPRINKGNINP